MRKAINENPVVQAVLIGVLVLGVGLLFLTRMGGSSAEPAPTATEPAAPTGDPAAAGAPTASAPAPTPPATQQPGASAAPASAPTDFRAGPGLPKEIVEAYEAGDAVVLLIAKSGDIDDDRLKPMVQALEGHPGTAVFVTDVSDVADYSRITEGVNLNRTPALVILRPKSLTDGPMPTAVVSYGFRGTASVDQALDDALYKGPDGLPYYPK